MLKTVTFAAMHFTIAFVVVYLMTGSVALGGAVAVIEPLCNTAGYYFHERVWERIRGRGTIAAFPLMTYSGCVLELAPGRSQIGRKQPEERVA